MIINKEYNVYNNRNTNRVMTIYKEQSRYWNYILKENNNIIINIY